MSESTVRGFRRTALLNRLGPGRLRRAQASGDGGLDLRRGKQQRIAAMFARRAECGRSGSDQAIDLMRVPLVASTERTGKTSRKPRPQPMGDRFIHFLGSHVIRLPLSRRLADGAWLCAVGPRCCNPSEAYRQASRRRPLSPYIQPAPLVCQRHRKRRLGEQQSPRRRKKAALESQATGLQRCADLRFFLRIDALMFLLRGGPQALGHAPVGGPSVVPFV